MGKEDILRKIRELIYSLAGEAEPGFRERDVVYLLVEAYKIEERELEAAGKHVREEYPHLAFFRDWVVHTHMQNKEWFERQHELNDPSKLLDELNAILNDDSAEALTKMWSTFEVALGGVTKDQPIASRTN